MCPHRLAHTPTAILKLGDCFLAWRARFVISLDPTLPL